MTKVKKPERLIDKLVLTPREVAALADMSPTTVYKAINAGLLLAQKKGRRTIILRSELDRYLESLPKWTPNHAA